MDTELEELVKKIELEKGIKINQKDLNIPNTSEMEELFKKFGTHAYDNEWDEVVNFANFKKGYRLAIILSKIQ